MSRLRLVKTATFLLISVPCLAVSLRIPVMEWFATSIHASTLHPISIGETKCDNAVCIKQFRFHAPESREGEGPKSVGFYNTFLSGSLSQDLNSSPSSYLELTKTPPNWYQFQDTTVLPGRDIWVTAIAPAGRKKIGMDWPMIFFGTPDQIAALSTVHSLFNTQLYIALSAITLVIALVLRVGVVKKRNRLQYRYTLTTGLLISIVGLTYSHLFDHMAYQMGISLGIIENVSKWFWGPSLCFLTLRRFSWAIGASAVYTAMIALTGGYHAQTPTLFHLSYPAIVAITCAFTVIFNRKELFKLQSPIALCLAAVVYDALVVNGVVPLITSSYLSPLAMPGFFAWAHRDGLRAIVNLAFFGHKQELVNERLEFLTKSRNELNTEEFLTQISKMIATGLDARRASVLILESGKPIIATYFDGKVEIIRDGYTPPVFARVLQTNEEMFLVEASELKMIRERAPELSKRGSDYATGKSIIVPLSAGPHCYGALAVTDFHFEKDILEDLQYQEHARGMITVIRSEVLKWTIGDVSEKKTASRKLEHDIVSELLSKAPSYRTPVQALKSFCTTLKQHTELNSAFFSFDESTEAATYVDSAGLSDIAVNRWSAASFYAKRDNKLSPIAIAINEKRPVFIEDINSFFGFLQQKSIAALEASDTRGLIVLPIEGFERHYGVLLVFQSGAHAERYSIDGFRFLERFGELLAIQAYQSEINARSELQESTLRRIIDPALVETVMAKNNSHAKVVGVVEDSFVFVLDFRGSTAASRRFEDPAEMANCLSRVYDEADKIVREYGGYFEKGNGDGLLFTLKNTPKIALMVHHLFSELFLRLRIVAERELGLSQSIVVAHKGKIFRGVLGTSGRMAWDNCGRDLVNAFDIEKHAKRIDGVVLAISESFCTGLDRSISEAIRSSSSGAIRIDAMNEEVYVFDTNAYNRLIFRFSSKFEAASMAA